MGDDGCNHTQYIGKPIVIKLSKSSPLHKDYKRKTTELLSEES